jgi:hypothetical protein
MHLTSGERRQDAMPEEGPEYRIGRTPRGQVAAETPTTSAPAVQHQFFGSYGYWLGDSERRYGRMRLSRNVPDSTKLEMLRDPIIAMAMGFIGATLVKARRVIECTDESKRRFFEAMFRSWEREFILQASMAVALGSCGLIKRFAFQVPQPAEIDAVPVWNQAVEPFVVRGFDQCYPVTSTPRFGPKRRKFQGMNTADGQIDRFYSLWLTLGQERAFGDYKGSGRLENVYKHWWLKNFSTDLYLVHLQRNINPSTEVEFPPGTTEGTSNRDIAISTGDSVRSGATVAIPSTVYDTVDQLSGEERLSGVKKWAIRFIESTGTVTEFHQIEDQCDRRMLLGMFIPYQALFEVTGGDLGGPTSADKLTELAEQLLLLEAANVDRHVNDYVFPDVSRFNFPSDSPRVRVRTVGLEQDSKGQIQEIVKTVLNRADVDPNVVDLMEGLERLGVPVNRVQNGRRMEPIGEGLGAGGLAILAQDTGDNPPTEVLERMAQEPLSNPPLQTEIPTEEELDILMRKLRAVIPEAFEDEA